MTSLPTPIPLQLVAAYDRLRLSIYRAHGRRAGHVAIEEVGNSTFLRFGDVSYFNTVYSRGDDIYGQFEAIEDFFRDSPHACRLHSAELSDTGPLAELCQTRGWVPDEPYTWLSAPCAAAPAWSWPMTIRPARRDETETFFRTYLEAFGADADRFPAAIDNMRHLFDEPSLHFLLAVNGEQPIGVGILMQAGPSALLCAGGMIPSFRRAGGHDALLRARLDLAFALGCTDVHSWGTVGGQSAANMERLGMRSVATTRAWRLPPRRRP
jgi:hypothetical protein